ncbi:MAG: glycosyl hydrolase 53 family protein [Pirellulales bacterium]|nr:glycosyl hydrolase 53 family protein [Pirellulales bacterium]
MNWRRLFFPSSPRGGRRAKRFCRASAPVCAAASLLLGVAPAAAEFMTGADISALPVLESRGAVYRDAGRPGDLVPMFREHGVNWFRLRLFVNPNGQGVVTNDLAYTISLAQRVKASGAKLLLDFHYSDTWADPGRQTKPAAWTNLTGAALVQQVHDYTRDSMAAFVAAGAAPEMVQIGNEISNGLLWNDGYPWSGGSHNAGFDRLADLLKAGIAGAKAGAGPEQEPLIMLHHDRGDAWGTTSSYFNRLVARNVDFDMIGYSYYPRWHGTIAQVEQNVNNTAATYGKPVVIVEAGFPSRGAQFEPQEYEFPVSPAGQQAYLQSLVDLMQSVPGDLGRGVFWWYPEAVPVSGLSVYEGGRYGLFDAGGNLLPAIDVFRAVNPPQPGDFTFNGVVDGDDLAIWSSLYGLAGQGLDADADGNGRVDGADLLVWQRTLTEFFQAPATTIPEPSTLAVAASLALIAWRWRRSPSR